MFKVVPDQIRIAGGWVRCGHCGEVFDASAHMLPYEQSLQVEVPAPVPQPPAPAPQVSFGPAVSMAGMLTHPSAAPASPAPMPPASAAPGFADTSAAPEPAPPPEPAAPAPAAVVLPDPPAFAPRAEAELFKPSAPVTAPEPQAPWAEPPLDMGAPAAAPDTWADEPTMPAPVEVPLPEPTFEPAFEPQFEPEPQATPRSTEATQVAEAPLVFQLDEVALQADLANLSSGVRAQTPWPATTAFSEASAPKAQRPEAPAEVAPTEARPPSPAPLQSAQVEVSAPLSAPAQPQGDHAEPKPTGLDAVPVAVDAPAAFHVPAAFELPAHLASSVPADTAEPVAPTAHAEPPPAIPRPRRRDEAKKPSRRSSVDRPSAPAELAAAVSAPEPALPVPEEELSFVKQAQRRAFWSSGPVRASLWGLALLLVLALGLQMAIARRDLLAAREPRLLPVLQAVCKPLGCAVRPYRLLDAMVIDSSAFTRLSGNQFNFSVTLRNTGDLPVATPDLDLTLNNAQNQTLVRRVVTAAELGAPPSLPPGGEFAATSTLTVSETASPAAVVGYLLKAFYP